MQRFVVRVNQLYERGADSFRIGQSVRRWWSWVEGGLAGQVVAIVTSTSVDLTGSSDRSSTPQIRNRANTAHCNQRQYAR